ncbi:type II secretion system protein [Clostridium estertheticum]|uniref:type II secretion system protein n=1 Tax=Clostridium estertheticum TaxID=238834 RepID=UPI001C7D0ADD|nr:type II secretion system protein [Clostridium estertheticum]MBX4265793.1 type II secretion system GspH family protein [Clostridium estertheticum]WLC86803.1 type II secretion system GspH family protein [Clostridium estertheticum]
MKKGFTLVELIVSLAIFSICMVAISMVFSVSFNTRQMNDIKQSTAGYSQAIVENFRSAGHDKLDTVYKGSIDSGVSSFVYFSDMGNFNSWFQKYISGNTSITGKVNLANYPLSSGDKFGALIKIDKISVEGGGNPYHIYIRVWRIDKGAKSQSVRDIYESR